MKKERMSLLFDRNNHQSAIIALFIIAQNYINNTWPEGKPKPVESGASATDNSQRGGFRKNHDENNRETLTLSWFHKNPGRNFADAM